MYPIVMFVGQAGSGKDTAAKLLAQIVSKTEKVTLAGPIKEFAGTVFGFTQDQLWGPSALREAVVPLPQEEVESSYWEYSHRWLEKYGLEDYQNQLDDWFNSMDLSKLLTARYILQTLGTEFGRSVSQDIWIDVGLREAQKKLAAGANLITITDGRFRNEILAVKNKGGKVIKIYDPDAPESTSTHPSEAEMREIPNFWFDHYIKNSKRGYTLNGVTSDPLDTLKTSLYSIFKDSYQVCSINDCFQKHKVK